MGTTIKDRIQRTTDLLFRRPPSSRCSADCPGWIVSESKGRLGIEACDECNANQAPIDRVDDDDVKTLPAAQAKLAQAKKEWKLLRQFQVRSSIGRRRAGTLRVRAAMAHLQQAQIEVSRAQADIGGVVGYVAEGERLADLYTKLKTEWYRLEARLKVTRSRIGELDREPTDEDLKDGHRHGCGMRLS